MTDTPTGPRPLRSRYLLAAVLVLIVAVPLARHRRAVRTDAEVAS